METFGYKFIALYNKLTKGRKVNRLEDIVLADLCSFVEKMPFYITIKGLSDYQIELQSNLFKTENTAVPKRLNLSKIHPIDRRNVISNRTYFMLYSGKRIMTDTYRILENKVWSIRRGYLLKMRHTFDDGIVGEYILDIGYNELNNQFNGAKSREIISSTRISMSKKEKNILMSQKSRLAFSNCTQSKSIEYNPLLRKYQNLLFKSFNPILSV